MMDQTGRRLAHDERLSESRQSQGAVQAVAGGPADDATREQIQHYRQIQPALPGPDVGDIDPPLLIGTPGLEHLVEQVRRHWPGMLAVGGALEAALLGRCVAQWR
ncbi:hypothetical protein WH91_11905 [Devosia psychrophila]|uniref:Uncharacterized protein n=1 Tax=Devosia psychrophila TaxID=728005 RepID=A0ABR5DXQ4_9HYPH|nr:hypothetical protein WH91_11905 [Devosia psychrophila]